MISMLNMAVNEEKIRLISTGKYISILLRENGLDAGKLAMASEVSERTVARILNDQARVSVKIADGLHALISGFEPTFILEYDAMYQYQKERERRELNLSEKEADDIIRAFNLRKLIPEYASDKVQLLRRAKDVFGLENLRNRNIDSCMEGFSSVGFFGTEGNYPDAGFLEKVWVVHAYKDALDDLEIREFAPDAFRDAFESVREFCFATTWELALFNMEEFAFKAGINFCLAPSVPNLRVKGASLQDREGRVFVFISDLVRSVEDALITFVNELLCIKKDVLGASDLAENSAERFFLGHETGRIVAVRDIREVAVIADKCRAPKGIVAEIVRHKTSVFNDRSINSFIHRLSPERLQAFPEFDFRDSVANRMNG